MRSAREQRILARFDVIAARLRGHDRVVLLGVALCFVPFPPATLAGFLLTCMNLVLIRKGRLPRRELPLLIVGLMACLVYATLWTGLILWMVRADEPRRVWDVLSGWAAFLSRLRGLLTGPPSAIVHV